MPAACLADSRRVEVSSPDSRSEDRGRVLDVWFGPDGTTRPRLYDSSLNPISDPEETAENRRRLEAISARLEAEKADLLERLVEVESHAAAMAAENERLKAELAQLRGEAESQG